MKKFKEFCASILMVFAYLLAIFIIFIYNIVIFIPFTSIVILLAIFLGLLFMPIGFAILSIGVLFLLINAAVRAYDYVFKHTICF